MSILTNRSNIRIGFEVECYIRERFSGEWEKAIKEINTENIIDDDGSIEPPELYDYTEDFCTYEIQTAVLPPLAAIENLDKIFKLIAKWGGANETCGLHLNISSTNKKRMSCFNPWPFVFSPIWKRMVRDFNREDNDFCIPPDTDDTPMGFFGNICDNDICSFYDKDSCVNFANWGNGTSHTARVEIRGMGGNKYHFRLPLITNYTKKVIKLFMLCCDIPLIGKRFHV